MLGAVGVPAYGELFAGLVGPPALAWKRTAAGEQPIRARHPPEAGMHVLASRFSGRRQAAAAFLEGRPMAG